ncbi:MAG: hypothetical protein ACLBM3_18695 [Dolichospermum sp.]
MLLPRYDFVISQLSVVSCQLSVVIFLSTVTCHSFADAHGEACSLSPNL